jgi:hypothetical protein
MSFTETLELLRLEKVATWKVLHELRCVLGTWNILVDEVECNVDQSKQITVDSRPFLSELKVAAEHVVASEILVLRVLFPKLWQLLA